MTDLGGVDLFLSELDAQNARALERIGAAAAREPAGDVTVQRLLVLALKNELEATECAAMWIPITREIDVKLALARQAGDEAKHYRLIEKRLGELGLERTAPATESALAGARSAAAVAGDSGDHGRARGGGAVYARGAGGGA